MMSVAAYPLPYLLSCYHCTIVDVERCVIISMVVMCNGIVIVIIEYDGRRPGLDS